MPNMERPDCSLIWQCVEHWAFENRRGEATVFGEKRLDWGGFLDYSDQIARALLEIGVARLERVAMLAMARHEFLPTFMAAAKIGATWLGVSPKMSRAEIREILLDAAPSVLIAVREYGERDLGPDIQAVLAEVPSIKRVLVIGEPVEGTDNFAGFVERNRAEMKALLAARAQNCYPSDPILLMYTSGSSGKPKGVLHTHTSIMASVREEARQFGLGPDSRLLCHFPINHVAADVEIGAAALYAGAAVVLLDHFHPMTSLEAVAAERVTVLGQVPAMFMLQLATGAMEKADLSSVRTFVWSGAPAQPAMVQAIHAIAQRTGAAMYNAYGATELAGLATYTAPADLPETLVNAVGRTVGNWEGRIVDEARLPVAPGEEGELAFRGPIVMTEYLNQPEATAEAVDQDGWFYTGDLGYLDKAGRIILTGRKSEVFKSGGEKVHPLEAERVLEQHPAVACAAVVATPDPIYYEVGRAFILPTPGQSPAADVLREHCRAHLANYKIPKTFEVVTQLPMLPTGKVDKSRLRAQLADDGAGG